MWCLSVHAEKHEISNKHVQRVSSHDLDWENKMQTLKRSIKNTTQKDITIVERKFYLQLDVSYVTTYILRNIYCDVRNVRLQVKYAFRCVYRRCLNAVFNSATMAKEQDYIFRFIHFKMI